MSETLSGRKAVIKIAYIASDPIDLGGRGMPQGVVLSLLLFNITLIGLLTKLGVILGVKDKLPTTNSEAATFAMRLATGFVAGTGASMMNIPFDVAKSRIQGPQPGPPGTIKYRTCLQSVRTVYLEEGFFALYKGLVPKVLRLGPGGSVMVVV